MDSATEKIEAAIQQLEKDHAQAEKAVENARRKYMDALQAELDLFLAIGRERQRAVVKSEQD